MRYKWVLKRLLLFCCVFWLLRCIFYRFFEAGESYDDGEEYFDDFDEAKDAELVKEYLKQMQMNRAYTRPIVEKEMAVEESYWCFLNGGGMVQEEKSRKWTRMAGIEVFSAYYDGRWNSLFPRNSAIQVLVMSNHTIEGEISIYCNIFAENGDYAIVKGYIREIWQKGWDPRNTFQTPSLITCPIPKKIDNPELEYRIGLVRKPCVNSKVLKKVEGMPKLEERSEKEKNDVAVCVKGLDYQEDISGRLLEWIEMQYLFGADKISLYYFYLTDKTKKLLNYYQNKMGRGRFEATPIELPGGGENALNEPARRSKYLKENRPAKRRHELIPYNDCFLSHIYTHKYVLIIDIDEVIVPTGADNYTKLLEDFEENYKTYSKNRQIGSISARNVFKFPSNFTIFPSYYHMISNKKRTKKTSPKAEYGKSFSSTASVITVFNHFSLHKTSALVSRNQHFSTSQAIKLHYKSECPWESRNECHQLQYDTIDDTSLGRFEKKLRDRVDKAVFEAGIF